MMSIVRVPASCGNVGPGFDVLGLALDLWNTAVFTLEGDRWEITVQGEGAGRLPVDESNLVLRAARRVWEAVGKPLPRGLRVRCENGIPLQSGLGSSGSAALLGVLGGNAVLGNPLAPAEVFALAAEVEGHPDNVAPSLYGGLTASVAAERGWHVQSLPVAEAWRRRRWIAVVVPAVSLSTEASRRVLPAEVPMADAVFNIGHSVLVAEAFRRGEADLLALAFQDRLHQPYRLPLIPGAEAALAAALQAGAVAAGLSGAGPGLIAFAPHFDDATPVAEAMAAAFRESGVAARGWAVGVAGGAEVKPG
ncbi:MAG TPA: homoserine kinase [Chloroflexi bacterium]|nr:homoserine kinase [Chloroflexota bacterium]